MKKGIALIRRTGFTLIEVLVTVVVIGVLAAVVIPAVTAQVSAGDSSRVIADLNNLRTGIENFDIAVRQFPGDVDDLINKPGTNVSSTASSTDPSGGALVDADVSGALYASVANWGGPYTEASLPSAAVSSSFPSASTSAFKTGYSATINNQFLACAISAASACQLTSPDYVVVQVNTLTGSQASTLNDLIDGPSESNSSTSGKWRVVNSGTATGYYFATPYK